MTTIQRTKTDAGAWSTTVEDGGGSQPFTSQTATLVAESPTFAVTHDFDLVSASFLVVQAEATVIVADGELFDPTHLGLAAYPTADLPTVSASQFEVSSDGGASFVSTRTTDFTIMAPTYGLWAEQDETLQTVGEAFVNQVTGLLTTLRTGFVIEDQDTGETYAGANSPSVTVLVTVLSW